MLLHHEPMSSASPKRNRSKVQKKGSHGGSRAGAGRKPSSSKLAVAAKGTFTLNTMGFKADGTTTGATTSAGATVASGSSSDEDGEEWRKYGAFDDERVSDDEEDEVDESATSAAAAAAAETAAETAAAAVAASPLEMAEAGSTWASSRAQRPVRRTTRTARHKWCAATSLPHLLHHFTSKIVHSDATFLGLGLWL